ncbi:uncharacterized protein LOC130792358 [Actinidia eriantha]|uniref:uncharacterized protein LOC130792358 n=1 Tax=Actinidia eriantha TaxID=165200 RepID=UPI00258908ED|nr:uncharacterized protein LOC130792358 [Actinidia eriantha]
MAKPQDTQPFLHNISPIKDHERAGCHTDPEDDYLQPSGCACFRLFSLGTGEGEQKETSWIKNKLQKAKEVSEVMAGPKWKNFLRRIGKWFHRKKKSHRKFQYDPYSYALNFDDGEEDDGFLLGNSSRVGVFSNRDEQRQPGL